MGIRCADHVTTLYPQKLALTSSTGGGRSVGIVRSRTKATEFFFFWKPSGYFIYRNFRVSLLVYSKYYAVILTRNVFLSPETKSYDYWLVPKHSLVSVSYLTDIMCVTMLNYSIRLPFNACLRTSPYCVFVLRNICNKQSFFGRKTNQMTVHVHAMVNVLHLLPYNNIHCISTQFPNALMHLYFSTWVQDSVFV